jgi:hypothetical protein
VTWAVNPLGRAVYAERRWPATAGAAVAGQLSVVPGPQGCSVALGPQPSGLVGAGVVRGVLVAGVVAVVERPAA